MAKKASKTSPAQKTENKTEEDSKENLIPPEKSPHFCYPEEELSDHMELYFNAKDDFYHFTSQGMCVAGDYLIYTRFVSDYQPTTYVVFDLKTKKEVGHYDFDTMHSNSLTYNPDTQEVVCTNKNRVYIFSFEDGVLDLKDRIYTRINFPKIAYVASEKCYYLATDREVYTTRNFYSFRRKFYVSDIAVDQGMGFDGKYLYIIWYRVGCNYIYTYDLNGNFHRKYSLISDTYREIEEVDFYGDQMFVSIANSPDHNGLYTVDSIHDWNRGEVLAKPSCAVPGLRIKKCNDCQGEKLFDIPATGKHKLLDWEIVKDPGCGTSGLQTRSCKICKQVIVQQSIPAVGHLLYGSCLTVPNTVFHEGKIETQCTRCGRAFFKYIPKLKAILEIPSKTIFIKKGTTYNLNDFEIHTNYGDYVREVTVENPHLLKHKDFEGNFDMGTFTGLEYGATKVYLKTKSGLTEEITVRVRWLPTNW